MPLLMIETNQNSSDEHKTLFLKRLSESTASALGKPERYVMVGFRHNPNMLFAGTNDPLAYLELKSIGLPADRTGDLSATLSSIISEELDVAPDRIYIEFANAERHMWGWSGGTFAQS